MLNLGIAATAGDKTAYSTDQTDVHAINLKGTIILDDDTHFRISYGGGVFEDFYGNFTFKAGLPSTGGITDYTKTVNGVVTFGLSGISITIPNLTTWSDTSNSEAFVNAIYASDNLITGSTLNDLVRSRAGDDAFFGQGGNDFFDGGLGTDTAVYTGRFQDYRLIDNVDGTLTVRDLRTGSPDGTDTLVSVENLRFTDKAMSLAKVSVGSPLLQVFVNVLRQEGGSQVSAIINDLTQQVTVGILTQAQAIEQMYDLADASTSVATLAYQFFTGQTPSSGGYDYLVSTTGPNPNNLNSDYYQSFNLENRYINFAVNLGKLGEGKAQFAAAYASKTLFDATKAAYATIFGGVPSDDKVHLLIDSRVDYFAYYGQDGATGIGTKAAMVGWLLAEAVKADIGMYAKANDAFLSDLSGNLGYKADLVGVYGSPSYIVGG